MRRVLIISGKNDLSLRQTPAMQGVWRATPQNGLKHDYLFMSNVNPEDVEYDFVAIRGKYLRNTTSFKVRRENIILCTSEPRSVFDFPRDYVRQFGRVLSCQDTMRGNNVVMTPPILEWFSGLQFTPSKVKIATTYDDYTSSSPKPISQRTKLLSVVSSNKAFSAGHQARLKFVETLKAHYGDQIDVFGRGFRSFEDKHEVLADYKYHIAIENSCSDNYFTEKLTDCFIEGAFPIYYGCNNINSYFPSEALCRIDINNPNEAIAAIDLCISSNVAEGATEILSQCRQMSLHDYNMFNLIAKNIDDIEAPTSPASCTIHPCHSMHSIRNAWNYTIMHNYYKLKYKLGF
ncbi:MAG: glycosyltransferase family 10 [Bacteroidia bacterium]|nr:glycosyltransferase family 10 [Bacteroidia bacterium]